MRPNAYAEVQSHHALRAARSLSFLEMGSSKGQYFCTANKMPSREGGHFVDAVRSEARALWHVLEEFIISYRIMYEVLFLKFFCHHKDVIHHLVRTLER